MDPALPEVDMIERPDVKEAAAAMKVVTDLLDSTRRITTNPEVSRWASIAITQCEIAHMCVNRALYLGE